MRRLIVFILLSAIIQTVSALSWHAVNIDLTTTAAMTSAYTVEALEEQSGATALDSILSHYKSGGIAMAGIYLSKKNDRNAMRNPGLFASEENYYYKRILQLVKDGIMPKLIVVAAKMLKYPENVLYWGPYLYRTTENVENLCKEFELVATNGKLSFKDVKFLVISDELKKIFDLAQLGGVDWKAMLNKLGDFGKGLTKEELNEDMKKFGNTIAQAGKMTVDANLQKATKIGDIFHSSTDSIWIMYDKFRETYEKVKDGDMDAKELLMQVVVTPDAAGVTKLFKVDDYNLTGYISNYIKELQGQYYTQRWYIYTVDSGTKILCDYKPESYGDNRDDSRWNTAWNHYVSPKDNIYCHTLTPTEKQELEAKAESQCGWSRKKVENYNKNNSGHNCTIYYTLNHIDLMESYKHGLGSTHHKRHCFYSYSVKVVDSWSIKKEVYEETFDSQSMDKETFEAKMQARLKAYNDNKDEKDENQGVVYQLGSDAPRYYTMADEAKMEGCNTVSFVAQCSSGGNLAEGAFNWKENSKSQKGSLTEESKKLAMSNSPQSSGEDKELLDLQKQYSNEISSLQSQISQNDKKMQQLIDKIYQAKLAGNNTLANQLQDEYDSLSATNAQLKNQLNTAQKNLNNTNSALTEYYNDLSDNLDGAYRIPSNMTELQSMYKLQWQDEGEWVSGSDQYTFVRHAYCPAANSNVTYTAVLKVARKPQYFLGIRIHRPILSVEFTLSANTSSENVIEVMKLDMSKSEKDRADEVNKRLKELMEDMPDCTIDIKYEYSNKVDTSDDADEDGIHLLWASDRLDIARDVEWQLTEIYAQLVFLEHVMNTRQSLLDFLKKQILDVVSRSARGTIAEYCLQRWEDSALTAATGNNKPTKKDNKDTSDNTTSKQ